MTSNEFSFKEKNSICSKRFRSDDEGDDRRKKFLERNRAAAARCRQKRKTWITSLEKKGEELQSTNSKLQVIQGWLQQRRTRQALLLGSILINLAF